MGEPDRHRTLGLSAGRPGADQPEDRQRDVPQPAYRRVPSPPGVPQAGHRLAGGAGPAAPRAQPGRSAAGLSAAARLVQKPVAQAMTTWLRRRGAGLWVAKTYATR